MNWENHWTFMLDFLLPLFQGDFIPHGACYAWRPSVIWLHAIADGMMALAYFVIPFLLIRLIRRRDDIAFHWMFLLFAGFIFLCGSTHLLNIVVLWLPVYWLEGSVKLVSGIASMATAGALVTLVPKVLNLPTSRQLEAVNVALAEQIAINKRTEDSLRKLNGELERRVNNRTAALARSNEDLAQFAYVASHDLQEPLRMVSNYTALLKKRYDDQLDDQARVYIQYAADGAKRMHELITDLLSYAQVGRASEGEFFDELSLDLAVNKALQALRLALDQSQAQIKLKNLPTVHGDESQMAQLFQNLIANALKYCSRDTPPEISIWAEQEGNENWKIFVKDNGVGFDMRYKERLFNMFQRLETAQTGTGIGLAICKKIVQRHGGSIDVQSYPGEGSTFFFTLPATRNQGVDI